LQALVFSLTCSVRLVDHGLDDASAGIDEPGVRMRRREENKISGGLDQERDGDAW
jgi:hypothetical protein